MKIFGVSGKKMATYWDLLYGEIELPEWLEPFVRIPEFARLRDVRLSNVDSIQFKDFGSASRWSHSIGVAYLASICAKEKNLGTEREAILILSGLLHDVATPPFAHTAEYVLHGYEHELETSQVLSSIASRHSDPDLPVFGSALPRFAEACKRLSRELQIEIRPERVAECILGEGELGYLVSGTIDLDNADNVVRGCCLMGLDVSRSLPIELAGWLAQQSGVTIELETCEHEAVQKWLALRKQYYGLFFDSGDQELGRQAFLQHLMRRALRQGLSRRTLVWNTDSGFLTALEKLETPDRGAYPLEELVVRYRLVEPLTKVADVEIREPEKLAILIGPEAVSWMERKFEAPESHYFVMVSRNRGNVKKADIFDGSIGRFLLFRLGENFTQEHLPEWLGCMIGRGVTTRRLKDKLAESISICLDDWWSVRPWERSSELHGQNVISALEGIGDWGFRVSRNRTLHGYPSTFVHAIPSALLHALGLRGGTVLDPFGGTGQTGAEIAKVGGLGVSADSNVVATMVARAKLTYLSLEERASLRSISRKELEHTSCCSYPEFRLREKWHHAETLDELGRVRVFIDRFRDQNVWYFLATCMSAILPLCTARRGKQHGFFADSTPLSKGETEPPYCNAMGLFLEKIKVNLDILEKYYGGFERSGRNASTAMERVRVLQRNVVGSSGVDYGLEADGVDAVITSPPYLCMADYSLGNRLSYYWLFPKELDADYKIEIGARRRRSNPLEAERRYFSDLGCFVDLCKELIRPHGFLALILGEPQAKAFKDSDVTGRIRRMVEEEGFRHLWGVWRPITWHRNHGYQRLRQEQLVVFRKE